MEISLRANNGDRCRNERHRFRIGIDTRFSTEFEAGVSDFLTALENAIIDHNMESLPGREFAYIQVWTGNDWRNVQEPKNGNVIAVTPAIAGQLETAESIFLWACDSVQMTRDINTLADGLSKHGAE